MSPMVCGVSDNVIGLFRKKKKVARLGSLMDWGVGICFENSSEWTFKRQMCVFIYRSN